MAEKFILHVGFHKTGTTAIQTSLHHSRAELSEQGITYLFARALAQHQAAWSLSQRLWGWKGRGGATTPASYWLKFAKQVDATPGTVVASSEFFSEINVEQIQKIRNDIKTKDVQIVFTIRPLVKLLSSSYQQYLKYGIKVTYEQWLHAQLDQPGTTKMTPSFWQRNFHGTSIANWAKVFGAKNVTVMVVDETQPQELYDQFNNFLGLPKDFLKEQKTGGNRSLSVEEIEFLRELNVQFPKERSWSEYTIFIRENAIKAMTDGKFPEGGKKLLTPQWAQDVSAELTAQSVEQIKASGVRVIGSLESLAQAKVAEGLDAPTGTMQVQTAVTALLSIDQNVVRKFRYKLLLSELARRAKARVFKSEREQQDGQ
jgi:hypothetical protein